MRRVRSKDTKPERLVRRLVSGMGFRYRLHSEKLAGHPDLVFSRLHKVILVHKSGKQPWSDPLMAVGLN